MALYDLLFSKSSTVSTYDLYRGTKSYFIKVINEGKCNSGKLLNYVKIKQHKKLLKRDLRGLVEGLKW